MMCGTSQWRAMAGLGAIGLLEVFGFPTLLALALKRFRGDGYNHIGEGTVLGIDDQEIEDDPPAPQDK